MKRRRPKETDMEQVQKSFNLLMECMAEHPDIEPTLWASAFWSVLVNGYSASGMSYDQFTHEWDQVKHHYKSWFDE